MKIRTLTGFAYWGSRFRLGVAHLGTDEGWSRYKADLGWLRLSWSYASE